MNQQTPDGVITDPVSTDNGYSFAYRPPQGVDTAFMAFVQAIANDTTPPAEGSLEDISNGIVIDLNDALQDEKAETTIIQLIASATRELDQEDVSISEMFLRRAAAFVREAATPSVEARAQTASLRKLASVIFDTPFIPGYAISNGATRAAAYVATNSMFAANAAPVDVIDASAAIIDASTREITTVPLSQNVIEDADVHKPINLGVAGEAWDNLHRFIKHSQPTDARMASISNLDTLMDVARHELWKRYQGNDYQILLDTLPPFAKALGTDLGVPFMQNLNSMLLTHSNAPDSHPLHIHLRGIISDPTGLYAGADMVKNPAPGLKLPLFEDFEPEEESARSRLLNRLLHPVATLQESIAWYKNYQREQAKQRTAEAIAAENVIKAKNAQSPWLAFGTSLMNNDAIEASGITNIILLRERIADKLIASHLPIGFAQNFQTFDHMMDRRDPAYVQFLQKMDGLLSQDPPLPLVAIDTRNLGGQRFIDLLSTKAPSSNEMDAFDTYLDNRISRAEKFGMKVGAVLFPALQTVQSLGSAIANMYRAAKAAPSALLASAGLFIASRLEQGKDRIAAWQEHRREAKQSKTEPKQPSRLRLGSRAALDAAATAGAAGALALRSRYEQARASMVRTPREPRASVMDMEKVAELRQRVSQRWNGVKDVARPYLATLREDAAKLREGIKSEAAWIRDHTTVRGALLAGGVVGSAVAAIALTVSAYNNAPQSAPSAPSPVAAAAPDLKAPTPVASHAPVQVQAPAPAVAASPQVAVRSEAQVRPTRVVTASQPRSVRAASRLDDNFLAGLNPDGAPPAVSAAPTASVTADFIAVDQLNQLSLRGGSAALLDFQACGANEECQVNVLTQNGVADPRATNLSTEALNGSLQAPTLKR